MDRLLAIAIAVVIAPLALTDITALALFWSAAALALLRARRPWLLVACAALSALSLARATGRIAAHDEARRAVAGNVVGLTSCEGQGTVVTAPAHVGDRMKFAVELEALACETGPPLHVTAVVYTTEEDVARGDHVEIAGSFAPPERFYNLDDVRPDEARRGVTLSGSANFFRVTEASHSFVSAIDRARTAARRGIVAAFPRDVAPLARALVLGESDIDPDDAIAFRASGLSHLLAVSGMHLVLVVLSVVALIRGALARVRFLAVRGLASRVAALIGVPLAWIYADFAGGSGSASRAAWMLSVQLVAISITRRARASRALAWSMLAMWAADSLIAYDVSFVLSALATAGIITGGNALAKSLTRGDRRPGFFAKSISASVGASIACAPVIARMSGAVPIAGVLANLVAVPVGEAAALPMCLVAACLTPWPVLERGAAMLASGALLVVRFIAKTASNAPGALLTVPPPSPMELAVMGIAALWMLLYARRKKHFAWGVIFATLALVALELVTRRPRYGELRVTVLDVGQGDASLVELPNGEAMLIDGGGLVGSPVDVGVRVIAPVLREKRIRHLRAVVLSHPHPDHFLGLLHGLDGITVDEFWDTGQGEREGTSGAYADLLAKLHERKTPVFRADYVCNVHAIGGVRIDVLAPCPGVKSDAPPNDNSFVFRISFGHRAFMFDGDAERDEESRILLRSPDLLRADVLKVGHHGSKTSSTDAWLDAVAPKLALVSCGARNRFGHPHRNTLAALSREGAVTLVTSRAGALTAWTDGASLHASTADGAVRDLEF